MNETKSETGKIPEQCKHFVVRKKRYCRMTVKRGHEFCGEHQPESENINEKCGKARIPCPLDNKHTCDADKLEKHLKKCNAKLQVCPYISKGVNSGGDYVNENRSLGDVSAPDILNVLNKVNRLYEGYVRNCISERVLEHEELSEELSRSDLGPNSRKHLLQNSSLLGHLRESNLLHPETCYVEFGAGKGQLSFWISKATESVEGSSVLLVERQSLRHKLDNKLDKSTQRVKRIRADIADLILNKVDDVNNKQIVGVAKHLCGDATDLALRCLINGMEQGVKVRGVLLAFCCHHRCHWSEYLGKTFFEENGLSKRDFDVICGIVSWATCGTGQSRSKQKTQPNDLVEINDRDKQLNLSLEEKEMFGKKCKLLIDFGRANFLQQQGFDCKLYFYVDQKVSLENVCIVATNKN